MGLARSNCHPPRGHGKEDIASIIGECASSRFHGVATTRGRALSHSTFCCPSLGKSGGTAMYVRLVGFSTSCC